MLDQKKVIKCNNTLGENKKQHFLNYTGQTKSRILFLSSISHYFSIN